MEKKLFRIKSKGHLGGVCAGLADYFQIDVLFIRALFLVSFFGAGVGLLLYFVLWIVLPKKALDFTNAESPKGGEFMPQDTTNGSKFEKKSKLYLGLIITILGFVLLVNQLLPEFPIERIWPILLIIIGALLIFEAAKNKSK